MTALPETVGQLKASGYRTKPVRDEIRDNLIARLGAGEPMFPGIIGYEETVEPALQNALLAGQDIIFLGERGQAKSRMIRQLAGLLDEQIPVLDGVEIFEDPLKPISVEGRAKLEQLGGDAPLRWIQRDQRYAEKLATPDITIRRPDRRGGPDQSRGGALPLGRVDDPFRPGAAHQSGHFLHQRAARPGRTDSGRPAQHHGRAGRADPRFPRAAAARCAGRGFGQSGGLHQPRADHHAAQGPLRRADSHALSGGAGGEIAIARQEARPVEAPRAHGRLPALHGGDRGRGNALRAAQPGREPALGRLRTGYDRGSGDARRQRAAARESRPGEAHTAPRICDLYHLGPCDPRQARAGVG